MEKLINKMRDLVEMDAWKSYEEEVGKLIEEYRDKLESFDSDVNVIRGIIHGLRAAIGLPRTIIDGERLAKADLSMSVERDGVIYHKI
ncbi:MAG: hypothetical protein DRP09_15040 [Candidatus Thorarchaeota archaeon]|nr:MAG: hypothetical protein DRP09_15040 [Candidatus Thorarchaeota archaeon]